MSNKFTKSIGYTIGYMAAIAIALATFAVSWIITCGIIKLITMCFGWTFNWLISTGIWLIMFLVGSVFNRTITVKR